MITKWLSYLQLSDFDASYLPKEKNRAADALSRRGGRDEKLKEKADDDNYFEAQMYGVFVEQREEIY